MGKAHSTMSGKPTGPRFDCNTGQPIPKFDPNTGKQNWWHEEGEQQLSLPPQVVQQQPLAMQTRTHQPVASINAAGQMVDADGISLVMDGGGRVWSAPYSKIMANEVDGCYCVLGLIPLWAAAKLTSEGEDTYTETGVFGSMGIWPFCIKFRRIPNTNTFRDDGCGTHKWSKDTEGQITGINNCRTICCTTKC